VAEIIDFEPTAEEQTLRVLRDATTGCFQQARSAFLNIDRLVWQNPWGLTPQQAFDALGTRAGSLVTYQTRLATFINQNTPGTANDVATIKPAGVTITVNGDGTVTLS
jgi:hypothetical protein